MRIITFSHSENFETKKFFACKFVNTIQMQKIIDRFLKKLKTNHIYIIEIFIFKDLGRVSFEFNLIKKIQKLLFFFDLSL